MTFNAEVLHWTLDNHPPPTHARHYIKEASFYGVDTWSLDLTIKIKSPDEKLQVDFVGIREKVMWPGKKADDYADGRVMRLFAGMDNFIESHTQGTVDPMFIGCVKGVAII